MTVTMFMLAVFGGGLVSVLCAMLAAPLGYQDKTGFHFGVEHPSAVEGWGLESPS